MTNQQLERLGVTDFDEKEFYPGPNLLPKKYRTVWHIRPRIAQTAQRIRDLVGGPVWVNTWSGGPGNFQLRGIRPPDDQVGAWWSQHKLGNALDFHVPGWSPNEVWQLLHDHAEQFHDLGITTLEHLDDTTHNDGETWGWIHADGRLVNPNALITDGTHVFNVVRH